MRYSIPDFGIDLSHDLFLIAGPCVVESREHVIFMASELKKITSACRVPLLFKASYDKANRTSIKSFRGPGLREGLRFLLMCARKSEYPFCPMCTNLLSARPRARSSTFFKFPHSSRARQTSLLRPPGPERS